MPFLSYSIHVASVIALAFVSKSSSEYYPTWSSLDTRPLPKWYDDAKFGIFMHWGVYSVPGYCGAWLWYSWEQDKQKDCVKFMENNYRPNFPYAAFAPAFRAEFFDPSQWAKTLQSSGAKYVVITSKHHEGYNLWPSKYSFNWNSMDVGPKRDLIGDLAAAIRNLTDIKFGLYHSLLEWFNPLYVRDKNNHFETNTFAQEKTMPELYELVERYKPEVIWSDGQWEAPTAYWKSQEFLAWLYNHSPVKDSVVVNDRWGSDGVVCRHGDFLTCSDRFRPGHLMKKKWENCMTVDRSYWAYQRDITLARVLTAEQLVQILVETVSCGGNLLMNVGPTADGRIDPIFEERLMQMGDWLKVNGEGIYSSQPWTFQNDTLTPQVWYTAVNSNATAVYAYVFSWPRTGVLTLGAPSPSPKTIVTLLGYKGRSLEWSSGENGGLNIVLPVIPVNDIPCTFVWGFKLMNLLEHCTDCV